MNFSNKRFAEVFASLLPTGAAEKLGDDERRRAPRIELRHKTKLLLVGDRANPSVEVELRDVSVRGMKFVVKTPLPRGKQFILAVPQLTGEPQLLLCTVVHSEVTDDAEISVGAEFTCPLPRAQHATSGATAAPRLRRAG
jgi:hypothetical protein